MSNYNGYLAEIINGKINYSSMAIFDDIYKNVIQKYDYKKTYDYGVYQKNGIKIFVSEFDVYIMKGKTYGAYNILDEKDYLNAIKDIRKTKINKILKKI
jgi:hypothetical protein